MSSEEPRSLVQLVTGKGIVVCCGSGGVGKTTTSAALAVEAARRGRRACVVTIDPAKRLADALGLGALTNEPGRVEGAWPGELWALMLDTKSTFDALVSTHAADAEQARRILENRLYRNLSGALSGTQEYMAMEKLHELHDSGAFDLIVIDTPPTRNALDFLEAPRRLTRFLENRVFRLLVMPGRSYLRAVSVATQTLVRTISKVVGAEVVDDAVAFFQAFEGMEEGFRRRAGEVLALLQSEATAFVLVTAPRRDAVAEASYFERRLDEAGIAVEGLVVNRIHPRFDAGTALAGLSDGALWDLGDAGRNVAELRAAAAREENHLADLVARARHAAVARVPFLASDVHDLDGLTAVADHLFGRAS